MKIRTKVYKNVREEYFDWNAYRGNHEFPLKNISETVESRLKIGEVAYEASSREEYGYVYDQLIHDLLKYLNTKSLPIMFLCEHQVKKKSRLRSYKGLCPKDISSKHGLLQLEFDLMESESIMGGIVNLKKLDTKGFEECVHYAPNSFILILNDESSFSEDDLNLLMKNSLGFSGTLAYVDYLKVINYFLDENVTLLRLGGDSSEYIALQFFDTVKSADDLASELTFFTK